MDADRSREALTDQVVDRELAALLAVDVSPEFQARVRARVAEEPQPRPWWLSWTLATAVAAAAVAVIAVFGARPRQQPAPVPTAAATADVQLPALAQAERGGHEPKLASPTVTSPARGAATRYAPKPATAAGAEAEVLLDPRETAALRALIAGVHAGRVDLQRVLRAAAPPVMDLAPVADITIDPITIDPLEQGARQ